MYNRCAVTSKFRAEMISSLIQTLFPFTLIDAKNEVSRLKIRFVVRIFESSVV